MTSAADVLPVSREYEATCVRCGEKHPAIGTFLGERLVSGPRRCQECEGKPEPELALVAGDRHVHVADADRTVEESMERLGLNVRFHGALTLEDMSEPAGFVMETDPATLVHVWGATVNDLGPYEEGSGLYLHSEKTGTGKTQLLTSLARHMLELGYPERRIQFDRARALATTIQDAYGGGDVDAVLDRRRKAGLWLLDDVGTERHTADSFRIMEDILDAREGHPTLWTSNLSPAELSERWAEQAGHDRFRSRLAGTFRFITVTGEDRRFAG